MKRADLERLHEIARLRSFRSQAELGKADARVRSIQSAIALTFPQEQAEPTDVHSARDRACWQSWAELERRRLTMELSRLRAEQEPLRKSAGRDLARAEVLEKILKAK
ncbi:hypothetical protein [Jannaschia aquimarina]|uniref:Uncharacterized protein n=1 Tax=Jannaschia aquimarina TaxID=935700 RepID=A0A0D1E9I0_9RHOB|nr:hypothetical protein [Jannaschia aquimarina]KIT14294.1 hypothetical protein jaqu_40880 [Jannaschia aquimarina]SNS50229.1 hypothetical protein SAMN05421775_101207 [Jannaschia aquimarina]